MLVTADEIDALLAADKRIAGQMKWSKDRDTTVRIRVPLQIGDAIVGGLFLAGTASVYNSPQDGSLLLQYQGKPIERMSLFPTAPHTNRLDKALPPELRGLILPEFRHRYHSWVRNRRWPRPASDNLAVAEPLEAGLANFAEAVQYFMQRTRIGGSLPPPRHEPRLM